MSRTYDALASVTLTANATTVTFSDIPSNYTDLALVAQTRSSSAAFIGEYTVNGDTGTNYSWTRLEGTGSAANSGRVSNYGAMRLGQVPASTEPWAVSQCHFMSYANTSMFKSNLTVHISPSAFVQAWTNLWRSTSVITSFTILGGTYAAGSTFQLFGIRAES